MNLANLVKFLKWFLWEQYVFYVADPDPAPDPDPDPSPDPDPDPDPDPGITNVVWPETWREQIAGEDEKELAQLGRYKSPADIWTKARALEQRLSSGEFKQVTPWPDQGTDEEKAVWRQANGIPATHDKYELAKEVGEDDKEVIDGFLKFAYDNNMPQAYTDSMISYFYDKRDADMKTMDEGDQAAAEIAEDALRNEWGNDYRGFMNRVTALLDTAPEEIKELFLDARMKGGTRLKDSPEAMKFMLDMAITLNPVTTIVPAGGDQMGSIQDELDTIKKFMRTNRKEYNKDQKMQERYRELDAEVVKAEAKA